MTNPEDVGEEELVTVDGIQFKPYQMECIGVLARAQKSGDIKKWIRDSVLSNMAAQLEVLGTNYTEPILKKLKKDGY